MFQAGDAPAQGGLGLVEDGQLVLPGQLRFRPAVGPDHGDGLARSGIARAATGHPVAHVVGEEIEPLLEAPLVQQAGFPVQELLHLAEKSVTPEMVEAFHRLISAHFSAAISWAQR
jgi:hypothetical protein